jgi:ABC-type lipoprotein export system ATPase subunit
MIEATALTFGYQPGRQVLDGWSGTVERGEIVAVVGPSGSGKSTLLYLLGALIQPWSGSVLVGGVAVERLDDRRRSDLRASTIGFVFQDALLDLRRSVLDNIIEGAVYRGASRRATIGRAGELLLRLDVGVDTGRPATDLSAGQAQRVALCRALLNKPAVLLADEPTGNLDAANATAVEQILHDHARRAAGAVVIVTHDLELAGRCDRLYRL